MSGTVPSLFEVNGNAKKLVRHTGSLSNAITLELGLEYLTRTDNILHEI